MREIKFRFWLGHTNKMTYPHTLDEIGKTIPEFTDDIIALQYTGLKDREGKEIYEGDILDGHSDGYGTVVYEEHTASFGYVFDDEASVGFFELHMNQVEVIGNIYENKDLL